MAARAGVEGSLSEFKSVPEEDNDEELDELNELEATSFTPADGFLTAAASVLDSNSDSDDDEEDESDELSSTATAVLDLRALRRRVLVPDFLAGMLHNSLEDVEAGECVFGFFHLVVRLDALGSLSLKTLDTPSWAAAVRLVFETDQTRLDC